MSSRRDFFFRQRVTEAELDDAFSTLEQADWNLAADVGITGIISGGVPVPHAPVSDLSIDLTAPLRAYDRLGRRVFVAAAQRVDVEHDANGLPTAVLEAGHERWVSVFLRFSRLLSEPRTDGNGQLVYWRRDEHFELVVRQGPAMPTGTAPRPALEPEELLVADVRRVAGQTQIFAADIDTSRRQAFALAPASSIAVDSSEWDRLGAEPRNVQEALDVVDAVLSGHAAGLADRHDAADIDLEAHGFVSGGTVQQGFRDVVDGLAATASGAPGASRVGADAAPGAPFALTAATVDQQLSSLLGHLNQHTGQAGAHQASQIGAAPHGYLASGTVQGQLEELVTDLGSVAAAQSGAVRIGGDAHAGAPLALVAGTLRAQLGQIVAGHNIHANATSGAHPASAIGIDDAFNRLAASTVEEAIDELLDGIETDHFRTDEAEAGKHRAIQQPVLGTGRVLLWESFGAGAPNAVYRMYADDEGIWHVIGARWNGTQWVRDSNNNAVSAWQLSRDDFVVYFDASGSAAFTNWQRRWRLPFQGGNSSSLVLMSAGMRETGLVALTVYNPHPNERTLQDNQGVTFRHRFASAPTTITFTQVDAVNWPTAPLAQNITADGFVVHGAIVVPAGLSATWQGRYVATL